MKKKIMRIVSGPVSPTAEKLNSVKTAFTVYFNSIIGKKIISTDGKVLGRLADLLVDPALPRPKIIAAIISKRNRQEGIDFSKIDILKNGSRYFLTCGEVMPVSLEGTESIRLAGQLLNRQVVDINRKKTVTVNDLKIAILNNEATVVAVDAGIQGRLRRRGLTGLVQGLLKILGISIANKLILWDNVEVINYDRTGTALSKGISKLDRLHPSDMADIIEELDSNVQADVFSALKTERAADVLEELESDTRESLLENLPTDKMADVLDIMPADEVADILDEVDEKKAEIFFREMDREDSVKIRDLMEYEDDEVGSLMTTDYVCFHEEDTVSAALDVLRREKPESDMIYFLNIISDTGELKAVVSLRDLVVSSPDAKLGDIMNSDVVFVHDTDMIESLNDIITKYNLLAVPVVDLSKKLIGMVIINDVVYSMLHSKRKRL